MTSRRSLSALVLLAGACVAVACTGKEATGNSGGVVVPTEPRECRLIECRYHEDCCVDFVPPEACDRYQTDCMTGNQDACEQYNQDCVCPMVCANEECIIPTCSSDLDCHGGFCSFASATGGTGGAGSTATGGNEGGVDALGRCVDCLTSVDCPEDTECIDGQCEIPCTQDEQCALFEACVNGECVEVACQDDHECVVAAGYVSAACVSRECRLRCTNADDCTGAFEACHQGLCVFVGCETNEQCRTYFGLSHDAEMPRAVCRTPE